MLDKITEGIDPEKISPKIEAEIQNYFKQLYKQIRQPFFIAGYATAEKTVTFHAIDRQSQILMDLGELPDLIKDIATAGKNILERQQVKAAFLIPGIRKKMTEGGELLNEQMKESNAKQVFITPDYNGKPGIFFIFEDQPPRHIRIGDII